MLLLFHSISTSLRSPLRGPQHKISNRTRMCFSFHFQFFISSFLALLSETDIRTKLCRGTSNVFRGKGMHRNALDSDGVRSATKFEDYGASITGDGSELLGCELQQLA